MDNTQFVTLKAEIDSDPDGRGYAGMTDVEIAVDLNLPRIDRDRSGVQATEVYNAIDQGEWAALTDADRQEIWDILHMGGTLNPFGREAIRFQAIFPQPGITLSALNAMRVEQISRAADLGLGVVRAGHVAIAKAIV